MVKVGFRETVSAVREEKESQQLGQLRDPAASGGCSWGPSFTVYSVIHCLQRAVPMEEVLGEGWGLPFTVHSA